MVQRVVGDMRGWNECNIPTVEAQVLQLPLAASAANGHQHAARSLTNSGFSTDAGYTRNRVVATHKYSRHSNCVNTKFCGPVKARWPGTAYLQAVEEGI